MMYLQPVSFKQNNQTPFSRPQQIERVHADVSRSGGDNSPIGTGAMLVGVSALILLSSWISSSLQRNVYYNVYSDAIVKRLKEENLVMKQAPTETSQKVDVEA